ncbi:MAG: hypothetical protein CMM50_15170 [Rhodospirillaceae bacterium]|nr:hypothetical protein [Rhodospirillaceae bacterium]
MSGAAALVRRSRALTCAWYVYDDWRARRRLAQGRIGTRSGNRHETLTLEQSVDYIERVWRDYLAYSGRPALTGTVCEIGPGDNFGVALLFRHYGADAVEAIDRYRTRRDPERQAAIYRLLAERHGLDDLFAGAPAEETMKGVTYHPGCPAETYFTAPGYRFDAIVSRAVLEHLYDPLAALDDMFASLRPGGILVHRIDLRDHGMFAGRHPLTFLTIPDRLYQRMTAGAGRPNRVPAAAYRTWLDRPGRHGSIRITRLVGVAQEIEPSDWHDIPRPLREQALTTVAAIRQQIVPGLRALPDETLAVSGIVLTAEKRTVDGEAAAQ